MAAFSGLLSLLWSGRAQGSEGARGQEVQFTGRLHLARIGSAAIIMSVASPLVMGGVSRLWRPSLCGLLCGRGFLLRSPGGESSGRETMTREAIGGSGDDRS